MGHSGQRYNHRKGGVGASLQMTLQEPLQVLFSLTHVGFSSAVCPAWKVRVFWSVFQLLVSKGKQK